MHIDGVDRPRRPIINSVKARRLRVIDLEGITE